jgi:Ca2+-binding EF-hand superfamily protein
MLKSLSHSRDCNEVVNLSISPVDDQNEVVINQKDVFSIEVILKYRRLFQSKKKAGIDSITEKEFKDILCCYVSSQYVIDDIYRKIDINCYCHISFSSFTNFLMTSDSTKKDSSRLVPRYLRKR